MFLKKRLLVLLLFMVCMAAAGCGRGNGDSAPSAGTEYSSENSSGKTSWNPSWNREGWGFVLEEPELSGNASSFRTIFLTKNRIYYSLIGDSGQVDFYYEENGTRTQLPVQLGGDEVSYGVNNLLAAGDGSLILLYRPAGDQKNTSYLLSKYSETGEQQYHVELMEIPGFAERGAVVDQAALDGDGRLYLSCGRECFLFDENGALKGSILLDNTVLALGADAGGTVYACVEGVGSGQEKLVSLSFEKCEAGKTYGNLPGKGICLMGPGSSQGLILSDGSSLYEYSPEMESGAQITSLENCGIYDDHLYGFAASGEDGFLVFLNHAGYKRLAFREIKDEETESVEKLVLGVIEATSQVRSDVGTFNHSNGKYEIELKEYGGGDTEIGDAVARLNADMISGNGPDLLNLSDRGLLAGNYVEKGLLEDLTPFLEQSSTLSREDLQEAVLGAYTIDGCLAGIPAGFYFNVMFGLTSTMGDRRSFSVRELISFLEEHPDVTPMTDFWGATETLVWLFRYNADFFLDYENGTCSFDSQDFRDLVYLTELLCREPAGDGAGGSVADGKVLLEAFTTTEFEGGYGSFASFYQLMEQERQGQEISMIGYPTVDGSCGVFLSTGEIPVYSILSNGKHKDGAWAFIENTLESFQTGYTDVIPTKTAELEKEIAGQLEQSYEKDAEGNILPGEDGSPVRRVQFTSNGVPIYYPLETDAQKYLTLIEDLRMIPIGRYDPVTGILYEEIQPYFNGQKTLDEAIEIIQGRIGLYISEMQ